ncbi:hypothetical protein [Paenibacillus sp. ISL-20]|nr:hypothetical protein [Paenibacillus sp. ISL-20]
MFELLIDERDTGPVTLHVMQMGEARPHNGMIPSVQGNTETVA